MRANVLRWGVLSAFTDVHGVIFRAEIGADPDQGEDLATRVWTWLSCGVAPFISYVNNRSFFL